jgi:hypothetical protein
VLWGGHGYGFRKLEPTFPRFLLPIRELLERYDVRYLLTMEGALPAIAAAELPDARVVTRGAYRLYFFDAAAARADADETACGRVTEQPAITAR